MSDKKPVKPEIVERAAVLSQHRGEMTNGHINYDKESVEALLPDDLDMTTLNKSLNFVKLLPEVVTYDVGEAALDAMEKDKDLQRVTGKMAIGRHGSVSVAFDRSHTSKPKPGSGDAITTYGHSTTELVMSASKGTGAGLKSVRDAQSERAKDLFS